MVKNFNNMAQLNSYINKQLEKVLKNDVSPVIKEKESEMVEQEVYAKYKPNNGEPWRYERRKEHGGLADINNMKEYINVKNNKVNLEIVNETTGDEGYLIADLVEGGDKKNGKEYKYKNNRSGDAQDYLNPRPFQEKTVEALNSSSEIKQAVRRGLNNLGIKTN